MMDRLGCGMRCPGGGLPSFVEINLDLTGVSIAATFFVITRV